MVNMGTKRLALIASTAMLSALMWWVSHRWLGTEGRFSDWQLFLWPFIAIIIVGAISGLALLLLQSRWDRLAVTLSAWATLPIFFTPNIWYLSILPVFAFFWLDASRRMQREASERHKFRIRGILGAGVRLILLGIFLMTSLGFYLTPVGSAVNVETITRGIQNSLDDTYDSALVRGQLADLPPSLQSQFRRDLAQAVEENAQRWLGPISPALPPLFALALFLGLWGVMVFVREPTLWVATGLFTLMRRTGFVTVTEEQVPKEVVSLS